MTGRRTKSIFTGRKRGTKRTRSAGATRCALRCGIRALKKEGRWEWNATSVVVFGRVKLVTDPAVKEEKLRSLASKYYPTADEVEKEMTGPGFGQVQLFAIEVEQMTGKLVNER